MSITKLNTQDIKDAAVTLAKNADIATASLLGRNTAGTGVPEVLTTIPTAVQDNITRLGTISSIGSPLGGTLGGTSFSTYATGDILYASATNVLSKLAASTDGYVLTLASGVPTWAVAAGGGITGSGTSGTMTKWTGSGSIGNSLLLDNGTNLYSGTASSEALFHLSSNVKQTCMFSTHVTSALGTDFTFKKSRGTNATPSNVSAGDVIATFTPITYYSSAWRSAASSAAGAIQFTVGNLNDMTSVGYSVLELGHYGSSFYPTMRFGHPGGTGTGAGILVGGTNLQGGNSGLGYGTYYHNPIVNGGFTGGVNFTVFGEGIVCSQRAAAPGLVLQRCTDSANPGVLTTGFQIGQIAFKACQSFNVSGEIAMIKAYFDGTSSTTSTPGYMSFYTTPTATIVALERLRMATTGAIAIGTNLLGTIAQLFTTAEGNSIVHQGSNSITNNILDVRVGSTVGPIQYLRKARGTFASTTDITNGDILGSLVSSAWSTSYFDTSKIEFYSDGTFTTNQRPPSGIKFYTNAANTAQTLALTINSAQLATFAGALTVVGTTTLATSLTGLLYGTSGVVSAVAASTLIGTSPGIWAKSVTSTVVNTTTETTIVDTGVGSMTLPVNFWTVGKTIKITITGTLHGDTSVTNRLTFKLYIGGTAISGVLQTTTLGNQTYGFTVDYVVSCRSTGGSGTLTTGAVLNLDSKSPVMLTNDAVVIDTTATGALDCMVTWQSADAAATVSAFNMVVSNAY